MQHAYWLDMKTLNHHDHVNLYR